MTNQRLTQIPTSTSSPILSRASRAAAGLALLLAAASPLACELGIPGNGQRTTETRALSNFSRLDSESSLDVQATQADTYSVTVSIDSNLQRYVSTHVSGDTLIIDVDHPIGDTVSGPHVIVTMPRLDRALLDGSGSLTLAFQQTDPVDLELEGSGDLRFNGHASAVTASLGGSGDMRLEGDADTIDLRLDGSGRIDARDLAATSADVSLSGSGDLSATVTGATRASLSGSGDINLYGGGTLEHVSVSGSGSIHQR